MAKVIRMHPPLAKWSGSGKVRLALPVGTACEFMFLLEDVVRTSNSPLSTPADVAKRAAQTLASETLARPAIQNRQTGQGFQLTVPQSQALTLLAWLLSSPRTDDAASRLRPLLTDLHQLLT